MRLSTQDQEVTDPFKLYDSVVDLKRIYNSELNPVTYLAIDPGGHNGICGYDTRHYLMFMATVGADDIVRFLDLFDHIKKCICEDYILYNNKMKQQINSDMETSRIIGRIEAWAEKKNVELIKQLAKDKPQGYAFLGKKPLPKTNPRNHEWDAHAHFTFWAVRTGRVIPKV